MTRGENTDWLKCPSCKNIGVKVLGDSEHRLQCIQCKFVWKRPSVRIKPVNQKEEE